MVAVKDIDQTCRWCGQTYRRNRLQMFCSNTCRARSVQNPAKTCQMCGKVFQPRNASIYRPRKFCSKACADEGLRVPPTPCEECGTLYRRKNHGKRYCSRTCSARANARKRPGWMRNSKGYILEWNPSHPNAARSGYVLQHRRIMADDIGRPLRPNEVVDHINGVKDDNRLSNLRVMTKKAHDGYTNLGRKRRARCPSCGHHFLLKGHVDSAGIPSLSESDPA